MRPASNPLHPVSANKGLAEMWVMTRTAVGGLLRPSLHGEYKLLTIPQLPLGGFKRNQASFVGSTLTIPRLPEAVHKSPNGRSKGLGIWRNSMPWLIPKGFRRLVYSLLPSEGFQNQICVDANDTRSWHLYQSCLVRFRSDFTSIPEAWRLPDR